MIKTSFLARLSRLLSVSTGNHHLIKAQFAALSRLIPLMYFILVANSWVLALNYVSVAPFWLTIYCPLLLTAVCGIRLVFWWRRRNAEITAPEAIRVFRRTNRLSGILSVGFLAWGCALFPYGDAFRQSHVAFYLAVTAIGCIICLMHLRSAALIVATIVGVGYLGFFAPTGNPTFIAMAVNLFLIAAAILTVCLIQNRDFRHMIDAQTDARRKNREQGRLLQMIDNMPVAVMTVDPETFNINYANETSKRTLSRIEHLLPITADKVLGSSIDVFHRHPEHQRRLLSDPANLPHRARIRLGPETLDLQVSAVTANDGSYMGPMLTWAIVTKEVAAESRIRQLAHYDPLTGLGNRNTFHEQLEACLASPESRVGLLFIDLDSFKIINDTKGHRAGDALLTQVAERLRVVCSGEGTIIGRLGGDEFGVLIPDDSPDLAASLAEALVGALGAPYHLDDHRRVQIGASIGIALAPVHGSEGQALLSRADIALYSAKAAGKGTYATFAPEMEARIQERVRLEGKLRTAFEDEDGLFVFYQPIVDLGTGKVTAREALMRWYHAQRGWISPSEFIPVAEESGLIDQLGLFVLSRACRDAAGWSDGAHVAVNISANQLGRGTLAPAVLGVLLETGLSPGRLEIEVTETALLNNEAESIADLRRLRDMGVRVALDDFGTGYSSLAHLRAFPFDKIKIDASFVRDAVDRPDCAAVVKAIADLGKRLGVTTVAEGVETQAQLDRIREEGCSEVQGYLYGRPVPNETDALTVDALNHVLTRSQASLHS